MPSKEEDLYDHIEELQLELGTMKMASNERCERDQREPQKAAETGISAQTTVDAHVGDDRTTHEANTVAEAHSALQAENWKLLEYAQSLQQHLDQLLAASREKGDP